jgi:hypothetical protein
VTMIFYLDLSHITWKVSEEIKQDLL